MAGDTDLPATLVLLLKKPLGDLRELALREPIAIELEQTDGDLELIARVAGLEDAGVLDALAASDYARSTEYLGWFQRAGQLIGAGDGLIQSDAVPEALELELLAPLVRKDQEALASLSLAEPTARQLKQARGQANWVTGNLMTVSAISGLPIGVLRRLAARDFCRASEYLGFFTRPGQLMANASSPISAGSTAGDLAAAGN